MVMLAAIVVFVVVIGVVVSGFVRGARGTPPAAPSMPTGPARPIPPQWHWAWLHERAIGRKSFGYYYRDPVGGPSFHIVHQGLAPDADALATQRYRGDTTVRLGAHETLTLPEGAADLVSFMREMFDQGGASGTAVLRLTDEERRALRLPEAPPWIGVYLR